MDSNSQKQREGSGMRGYLVTEKLCVGYQRHIVVENVEIELEKAKKWDGRQVPEYVPLTAAGGIVTLPAAKESSN